MILILLSIAAVGLLATAIILLGRILSQPKAAGGSFSRDDQSEATVRSDRGVTTYVPATAGTGSSNLGSLSLLLSDLLQHRSELMLEGQPASRIHSFDKLISLVFAATPSLARGLPASESILVSLREVITGSLTQRFDSVEGYSQAIRQIDELLTVSMISSGSSIDDSRDSEASLHLLQSHRAWFERLAMLPPLTALNGDLRSAVSTIMVGDYAVVENQLSRVSELHRYDESYEGERWEWFEAVLQTVRDDRKLFIEWEVDDEVDFSMVVTQGNLNLFRLDDDSARRMIEEEEGSVVFESRKYRAFDGGEATFYRDRGTVGARFQYIEFEGDSDLTLSIEDWGDKLEAFVVRQVRPTDIRFFKIGGD